jgi:hypothetical protein
MTEQILVDIKQKTISINRLFKVIDDYRKECLDNPQFTREDHLHILNFVRFMEKRLKRAR